MFLVSFDELDEGGGATSGLDEAMLEKIFGGGTLCRKRRRRRFVGKTGEGGGWRDGKERTVDVFLVRQSEMKSLKAGEKLPSRTGGLAFGIRKRTRMAGIENTGRGLARWCGINASRKGGRTDGDTRKEEALLSPSRWR